MIHKGDQGTAAKAKRCSNLLYVSEGEEKGTEKIDGQKTRHTALLQVASYTSWPTTAESLPCRTISDA